jgi:hypothetical protein
MQQNTNTTTWDHNIDNQFQGNINELININTNNTMTNNRNISNNNTVITAIPINYDIPIYDIKYEQKEEKEKHMYRYNGKWPKPQIISHCEKQLHIPDPEYTNIVKKWVHTYGPHQQVRFRWVDGSDSTAIIEVQKETDEELKNRILPGIPDIILVMVGKTGIPYDFISGISSTEQWQNYLPKWLPKQKKVKYLPADILTIPYRLQSNWLCNNRIDPRDLNKIPPNYNFPSENWMNTSVENRWKIILATVPSLHNYIEHYELIYGQYTSIQLYPRYGKGLWWQELLLL